MLTPVAIALLLVAPLPPAKAKQAPTANSPSPTVASATTWSRVSLPAATANVVLPKYDPIALPKLPSAVLGKCKPGTRLFVVAGAVGGDGREASPFGTVAEATTHAATAGWCEVDLRLAPGTYEDSIIVDRNTTLRRWNRPVSPKPGAKPGQSLPIAKRVVLRGAILNGGPHRLVVEDIALERVDEVAAIMSFHAKGETHLHRVTIRDATRRGIYHAGGKLVARHVKIAGTARADGDVRTGVAIDLARGANARLESVTIVDTAAQALAIRGATTIAVASDLDVRRVQWHPASLDQVRNIQTIETQPDGAASMGFAAILVDEGAFFVDGLRIEHAHFAGVFARRKARVRIRNVVIEDTHSIDTPGGAALGGIAIAASSASTIDVAELALTRNPWIGIFMTLAAMGSVRDGVIRESNRGVVFPQFAYDAYDPLACVERVEFVDVARTFATSGGPVVPSAGDGLDDALGGAEAPRLPCPSLSSP
jgi:hypothetical protein